MDIEVWLRQLGLADYAGAFRENHITVELLPNLSASDLAELGVKSVGHRRVLLGAIGELGKPQNVPASSPAVELPEAGERRQVTVLFADIAGYTALSNEIDAEQVHRVLAAFFEQVDTIVVSLGGRIDKHIGDCVMAVFGAPVAHADDVQRGALAAIRVHEAMQAVSSVARRPIAVHVGLATGEVVAGRTGSSSFLEYTITGETVNLASRLADVAEPGKTVVTGEVMRALGHAFEGDRLPEREIRGFARRIELWSLASVKATVKARQLPLVGRRSELHQCLTLLREMTQSGAGATVVVVGEPGIGKTRLVEEIAAEAASLGVAVARGAFIDFGAGMEQDVTGQLAMELDRLCGEPPTDPDVLLGLKGLLRQILTPDERSILEAMTEPQRAVSRSTAFINTAVRAGMVTPLLIIVEDVHWASPQVLAYLERLGRASAQSLRAVVLLTTRPPGADRPLFDGLPSTTIELGPLRTQEALALARLHASDAMPDNQELVDRSGGNPLFLEQLIRHSLQDSAGGALPGSIRSLVLARIDLLSARDKLALQTLAVLGDEPPPEAQSALIEMECTELGTLLRQRFLQRSGESVRFVHALIREVAYGAMLKPQRTSLHRKAASWFKDRDPLLYAQHLVRGEDPAAPLALLEAARHLQADLRLEEALSYLRQGLSAATDRSDRFSLLLAEGELLLAMTRSREAIERFEQAEHNAQDDLARAAAMLGRAGALRLVDSIDAAFVLLDQCTPLLEAVGAHAMLSRLEHLRGNLHFPRGEMAACAAAHARAFEWAERAGMSDLKAQALGGMGDAAYAQGLYATASKHFSRCIELARQLNAIRVEIANRPMQVISRALSGKMGGIRAEAEEVIRQAIDSRQPRAELIARHATMISHFWAGRAHLVEPHFVASQAIVDRIGARRFEPENLAFMAEAMRQLGNFDEAQRLVDRAVAICRETGMSYIGGTVLSFAALLACDDPQRCQAALHEAEQLASTGLKHNAWFFGCNAIECAVAAGHAREVERYVAFLEQHFSEEPLPTVEVIVERGRLLARKLDGVPVSELFHEAQACRERLQALEMDYFARALEALADV
ncbi:MAG: adenylate/guanylate cyclase domain-containing protein [Hyphomicrobiaceae bacterium]